MGQGFNTELGDASHAEFTRHELHAIQSKLTAEAEGALVEHPLTIIDIPSSGLTDEGATAAGSLLQAGNSLQYIDVSYNELTAAGTKCLFLGNAEDGSEGLAASPGALKNLQILRLSGNKIGLEGVKALCKFLRSDPTEFGANDSTEPLDSSSASLIEFQTAQEAAAAHVVGLQELYLYNCDLDDYCFLEIVNSLLVNPTLHTLHLDMNPRITGKSVVMLKQLLSTNRGLCRVSLGNQRLSADSLGQFPAGVKQDLQEEVEQMLQRNAEIQTQKARIREIKLAKAKRRAEREEEEQRKRNERDQAELEKKQAEMAVLEELRVQEEAEVKRLQAIMAEKMQARGERAERLQSQKQAAVDRALENAEKWKSRMTGNGTLQKEWRSGFTTLKTDPGDITGVPKPTTDAPRLLRACWCDPQDATAPFANTLHYHCKYEMAKRKKGLGDVRDDGDGTGPALYDGCKGEGHRCASENFRNTKPLPDHSAAHFFSSPHPATAPGVN